MAEVLGIVGSVIGIAQLAGTIIATGTKLSGILKEVQDIPDEISIRLEQLHMLSLSLQHSEGAGTTSIPSLHNARQHCLKCLSGLTHMLEELTERLQRSRGARRKASIARHILRKDEVAKVERRLSHSVELLTVANQMYMIHLLESQRLGFLHGSLDTSAPTIQERTEQPLSLQSHAVMSTQRLNNPANSLSGTGTLQKSFCQIAETQEAKSTWGFGFACITGSIQLELYQFPSAEVCDTGPGSEDKSPVDKATDRSLLGVPKARIKVRLPTWWSNKVIEALVYRSQVGWSQLLRTRNIFDNTDENHRRALDNIANGDLAALVKQCDQRQVTPWDEFRDGWSLLSEALQCGQWTICSFLLDHGAQPYAYLHHYWPGYPFLLRTSIEDRLAPASATLVSWEGDQRLLAYQQLIMRTDQNESLLLSLLGHWKGSPVSLTNFRRSLWPDGTYYSDAFLKERMQITTCLVLHGPVFGKQSTDVVTMARFALEQSGDWTKTPLDMSFSTSHGETIFHGIAGVIGLLGDQQPVEQWLRLITDIVDQSTSLVHLCQASARSRGPDLETPLLRLIQRSFDPKWPFCCQMEDRGSVLKRIQRCERTISTWLDSLRAAGVDLVKYGQEERQRRLNEFGIRREFGLEPSCHDENGHNWWGYVRLIKFDFGECPSQWKFWWSEMTDKFAGDFWHMIEEQAISSLKVPGAWVDDNFE